MSKKAKKAQVEVQETAVVDQMDIVADEAQTVVADEVPAVEAKVEEVAATEASTDVALDDVQITEADIDALIADATEASTEPTPASALEKKFFTEQEEIEGIEFPSVKFAGEFLCDKFGIKITNAVDGIYKSLRRGTNKTHGYKITKTMDNTIILNKIV
mgnify:CR=1 FL=1